MSERTHEPNNLAKGQHVESRRTASRRAPNASADAGSAGAVASARRPDTRRSAIAIAVLVVLVAVACFATHAFAAGSKAACARITDADGATYCLPLDEDATLSVTSSAGTNIVQVEGGSVRVTEADCPNHDCIGQGRISETGQQIVCLPNKLVVSVEGGADDEQAFDVVGS